MARARMMPLLLCCSVAARAEQLNLQAPVTPMAAQEYELHTLLLIITGLIFVGVLAVMLYAIVRHRKAAGHTARQFHENTTVEILWTLIPFLILVAIALPATRSVLAQKRVANEDMTIKVTGFQWKWRYDYLDQGFGFMSHLATPRDDPAATQRPEYLLEVDQPLVVPTGKKVRLLLTANDVIHSWYVPQLGVKQDAIPGYYRDTWFQVDRPGTYRGQCTELCGKDHGFMPIVVEAKTPAEYDQWVAAQKKAALATADDPNKVWTLEDLKARGQQVYSQNCVPCHQANGRGIPGTFPALDGSTIVTKDRAAHIDIVLNGSKRNTAMPAWGKQLSDTEIAAVISYERNAWGNHTGESVQPSAIRAARAGAAAKS
ncbi:cytochrome c oxidase subunit II [Paludibacterium purpuratum]|uniref:Cytochrome c oxidase subunit 2 n=1 Tax=Paludibacterium purpuratum TaxID=1144873 RepID=A0A4R7B770_9NEIS|nr:cytochrome c oxidase subunit II [Paludibacterium purpuratum]TDR80590.1 cytochrome c oxidase subunit 2 [Paludibacterium purpuratum]